MGQGKEDPMERRDLRWAAGCLAVAFCFVSKEAVRYTALWTFELKSALLMTCIMGFAALGFAVLGFAAFRRNRQLWSNNGLLVGLAALSCAGMVVHGLRMNGLAMPEWAVTLSFVAIEASLLLLVVVSQYLLCFSWASRMSAFAWGVVIAGVIQILLAFMLAPIAQAVTILGAPLAVAMLLVSRRALRNEEPRPFGGGALEGEEGPKRVKEAKAAPMPLFSMRQAFFEPKSFSGYCLTVFLLSIVLMGAYSQWRGQQDGHLVSMLVQVASGFGFMLPALAVVAMEKSLQVKSLFYLSQTTVLPIALGALYLATAFSGPSVSLSVVLFDAAYALMLFVIWLAPRVFEGADSFAVMWMGLLIYKMGWFVGVLSTASLSATPLSWVGNVVVVVAFLLLVATSAVSVMNNYRSMEHKTADPAPAAPPFFERACEALGEEYALTEREREVLWLLARGRTASYIARDLVISEPTVRTHTAHIYRKMQVNSQQQLLDKVDEETKKQAASSA